MDGPSRRHAESAETAEPGSAPVRDVRGPGGWFVSAGKRPGRRHRQAGTPCQDAYTVHEDPERRRAAAAVADGLGSQPLSHLGSQAACDAAVASLAAEPAGGWDEAALRRAFQAAHDAVAAAARERGLAPSELATTLQVAMLEDGHALAGMVGDGAIVAAVHAASSEPPALLAAPGTSGYANEVVPLTDPDWRDALQVSERDGVTSVLLFTDGLTRLLLARGKAGWAPYGPFFDAFLPQVAAPGTSGDLVDRFLGSDAVDRSWDDDKCLVVVHSPAARSSPSDSEGAA